MIKNYEKPFFIGCTPLNKNKNRYMKWNSYGIIRHFDSDNSNLINVQFHDTNIHHSFEFRNDLNYNYADLSSNSVIFSSTKTLHCYYFDKKYKEIEWTVQMPKHEYIKSICLGNNFIGVGTSLRNLRLFSLNGMQYSFISIPGPISCLVAKNDVLVAFYYHMLPLNDSESLEAMFLKVNLELNIPLHNLYFSPIKVALNLNSNLLWAGFTDEGTFCIYDTDGSLKLLKNNLGFKWIEIGNLFRQVDEEIENIFVISLSDFLQEVRCVYCYESNYPTVKNVPIIQKLKFNLNMCQKNEEIMQLEEKNILLDIKCSLLKSLYSNGTDTSFYIKEELKSQVEALFKLFLHGANENKESFLLDAARMMPNLKTIDTLIKYSEKKNLIRFVPKLNEIKHEKENEEIEDNEEINTFTTLPCQYSLIKLNEKKENNDFELMPLNIDSETFRKSSFDKNLNKIDSNSVKNEVLFLNEEIKLDKQKNVIDKSLNDDLIKLDVNLKNIDKNVKNPFKIENTINSKSRKKL